MENPHQGLWRLVILMAGASVLAGCGGEAAGGGGSGVPSPVTTRPPAIQAAGLSYQLPTRWVPTGETSSMRLVHAQVPGESGAAAFHLSFLGSGGGGAVDANITRWISQVSPDTEAAARRESFEVGPLRVTWVEATGNAAATSGETGEPSRLLGAIVEGAEGPWFLKLMGPDRTVAGARSEFMQALRTVEPVAATAPSEQVAAVGAGGSCCERGAPAPRAGSACAHGPAGEEPAEGNVP